MSARPLVDVNLFVYNGASTVGPALESLLAQTWPNLLITLFDDGSSDGTAHILAEYAAQFPAMRLRRAISNGGAVAAFQRAFWAGEAEFVMPKSADDMIAPDFVEKAMAVLEEHPGAAMCHAAGLVFTGDGNVREFYPAEHRLFATDADPFERALKVMQTYTSSPSFWGIYRRSAVDRLAPILFRAGWDHVLLAELALYGEIRHVPEILYWRRDGGRPVHELARRATLAANRGLPLDGPLAEQRWRTPLITTAYAHLETFAVARVNEALREKLMAIAPEVFRARWLTMLRAEARELGRALPGLIAAIAKINGPLVPWATAEIARSLWQVEAIVPEVDFSGALGELATLAANRMRPHAVGAG